MTKRSIVLSLFALVLAVVGWSAPADELAEATTPNGILERINALEKQAAATDAEVQADRELISTQSIQIAILQEELKAAKDLAAKATSEAEARLFYEMKADRKELYADICSIVSVYHYKESEIGGWGVEHSHRHYDRAIENGFLAGVRNGHHDGKNVGSISFMPRSLIQKNNSVAAEVIKDVKYRAK